MKPRCIPESIAGDINIHPRFVFSYVLGCSLGAARPASEPGRGIRVGGDGDRAVPGSTGSEAWQCG
jgi:hypothetical protein